MRALREGCGEALAAAARCFGAAARPLADRRLDRGDRRRAQPRNLLVPSPAEIAESLWENRGLLAENAWVTLREIVFGILVALFVGVGFAVVMHRWRCCATPPTR